MRPGALILSVLLAAVALAGCGGQAAAPQPFAVPPSPAAPAPVVLTPEQEQLYGPRVELPGGLLLKQFGKVAQWGGPDDTDPNTWGVRVVVDSVEVDPKCGEYTSPPARGHRLVVSLRAETSSSYNKMGDGIPQYFEWSTIGPDGVTEAPPTSSLDCHQAQAFPQELRPSAKYRGEVTVETSNPAGRLVLADLAAWDYGASG